MRAVWVAGAAVAASVLGSAAAVPATAAPASVAAGSCTSYAYAGTTGTDPNGFTAPGEASFAAACVDGSGYDFARHERGPSGTVTFGSVGGWAGQARSIGLGVGSTPAVGRLVEVASGGSTTVTRTDGTGAIRLLGPYVGVVVDTSGGLATFRVWDGNVDRIDTYRMQSATEASASYIDVSGGQRVAVAVAPTTPAATPTATPTSASPSPSATPSSPAPTTPAAVADPTTPAPESFPFPTTSAPTASATPGTSEVSASSDDSARNKRYGFGAASAVLIVLVLSVLARVLLSRRRKS